MTEKRSKPLSWYREVYVGGDYECVYCGREMLADFAAWMSLEVDHLIPVSAGGNDSLENRVCSCNVCNRMKHAYVPEGHESMTREQIIEDVRAKVLERRKVWKDSHESARGEYEEHVAERAPIPVAATGSSVAEPDEEALANALRTLVADGTITIDEDYSTWNSGVYNVIDCVFSSQAKYESMVLPILRERLPSRPGMRDTPELKFTDFMRDVDSFGPDKWDRYASEVLQNKQVLSGRRKVEVCYDIAHFFVHRGFETLQELGQQGEGPLLDLVLGPLQRDIKGIGPALSRYLAILLGVESQIKPDTMIIRFFDSLSPWSPRMGNEQDIAIIEAVITQIAKEKGTTPARLDNAIWLSTSYHQTESLQDG